MMFTTIINTFKTSRTQLVILVLKNEFGRNGSICAFDRCYKTSLIKLFNTNHCLESLKKFQNLDGKLIKKDGTVLRVKTNPEERISLLNDKNEIVVMKLFDAQKLALTQGLNLLLVTRKRGQHMDMYKMVTDKELIKIQDDTKQFVLKSKITDHDLQYKIKQLMNNLDKRGVVQLSLKFLGSDAGEMKTFIQKIKNLLKQGTFPVEMVQTQFNNKIITYLVKKKDSDNQETEDDKNSEETNKTQLAD